jgi:hypothetical protein
MAADGSPWAVAIGQVARRGRGRWPGRMGAAMAVAADADRDDDAARSALAWYDLGEVLSLDRLPAGRAAVRKVTASTGTYLLKPAGRRADVALLAELAALGPDGVRQPEVIRTGSGQLVSPGGWFLQEFLAGELELEPSGAQVRAVMRAAGSLHVALGRLAPAVRAASLAASRAAMARARPWPAAEQELWAAGLVWEGLRRLATTLELARRLGADPGPAAAARLAAVEAITTLLPGQPTSQIWR